MLSYALRLTGAERGFVFLGENPEDFQAGLRADKDGKTIASGRIFLTRCAGSATSQLILCCRIRRREAGAGEQSLILPRFGACGDSAAESEFGAAAGAAVSRLPVGGRGTLRGLARIFCTRLRARRYAAGELPDAGGGARVGAAA